MRLCVKIENVSQSWKCGYRRPHRKCKEKNYAVLEPRRADILRVFLQ